jgi:hypothetical protein
MNCGVLGINQITFHPQIPQRHIERNAAQRNEVEMQIPNLEYKVLYIDNLHFFLINLL